ncbi:gamma-butyrobetaine dioxygenase [Leucosporidium creatinivorum]|uniref:Gamma-butyrobetaine dioxygenase n=1 Tax=Leucosporidium creatinivorum TaxID=106004 RepID=A0A1Y2FJR6_9BASI|nr:gamma-butyrobetaine dioxygenase [Leucosporidium creatinivorum]
MEWSTAVEGVEKKAAKLSVTPLSLLLGLVKGKKAEEVPSAQGWDKEELEGRLGHVPYSAYLKNDGTLLAALDALLKDGILVLEDVPTKSKEGQQTELRKVVERMASVRRTWYGDLFDVKAEKGSKNIAYTNLDLGLHMDLTHFAHPPRYQFLHSLLNTNVTGGSSYFVDTFAICSHLHQHHPSAFETLCTEPLLFSYTSSDHATRFVRPVIELAPGSKATVQAVNYSPPFQGPLVLERMIHNPGMTISSDDDRLADLHEALRLFADLCDSPSMRFEKQLQPGDCVVFDNRRVLHARTAFSWEEGKEGGRWLKGAYCDGDEVKSKWRVLDARRAKEKGKGK